MGARTTSEMGIRWMDCINVSFLFVMFYDSYA